jgi:hypothetical protein
MRKTMFDVYLRETPDSLWRMIGCATSKRKAQAIYPNYIALGGVKGEVKIEVRHIDLFLSH